MLEADRRFMEIGHELRDLRRLLFGELWMVASQALAEMRDELMAGVHRVVGVRASDIDVAAAEGPIVIRLHPFQS
ncbi:MAG TPA: hypothetical protein VGG84_13580 [Gemmatimonadaceae bacterium]